MALSFVAACGPTSDCPGGEVVGLGCVTSEVVTCRARTPTVSTGVFGCVTTTDDVGPVEPAQPLSRFAIHIFEQPPPSTLDDGVVPAASTQTDEVGFFELSLAPGRHWICTAFRRCAPVDVSASVPHRMDYDFGVGPGW
ncbi:MAG TPA: hypothetical protein VGG33_23865 [Polyangia bacterium]